MFWTYWAKFESTEGQTFSARRTCGALRGEQWMKKLIIDWIKANNELDLQVDRIRRLTGAQFIMGLKPGLAINWCLI